MNMWTTADPASIKAANVSLPGFIKPIFVYSPTPIASPIVFSFPHSGRKYSNYFQQQSQLSLTDLRSSEDAFVDELFPVSALDTACFVRALFPRAWVDANRHPQALDPDMFFGKLAPNPHQFSKQVLAGLGVIPKIVAFHQKIYQHRLPTSEIEQRLATTHTPYHQALSQALAQARERFGWALLVDCHSMPSVCAIETASGPADVVLGDRHGTSCDPRVISAVLQAFERQNLKIVQNLPYAGGYSILRHGRPSQNIHALQIELSRDLYMNEKTIEKHHGFGPLQTKLTHIMHSLEQIAKTFHV
ncbi:MAG: N-formylglutamate amidohydrolase [Robiginitomaculum sp.]|nr:N-formylglutamate amidohydrolase [Robiginitomaculum sp.]